MDAVVSRSRSGFRFQMWLMTIFAAMATALAAIGIYGLMTYSIEQRLPEIGIRMAMGASAGQVQWR